MIDVALTPDRVPRAGLAVVIDVLRATSTVTVALACGYRRVLLAESIERAEALRGPGRVLAGERRCVMPPGFDLGNSPQGVRHPRGEELVLVTTNGTPAALAATRAASSVILASLLNLDAVIVELRSCKTDTRIQLVCAGTDGAVALEDVYAAGRLSAALRGNRTDAARVAEAVARTYQTPLEALSASADAAALRSVGLGGDIADCARVATLDAVPRVVALGDGFAVLAVGGQARPQTGIDSPNTVGV